MKKINSHEFVEKLFRASRFLSLICNYFFHRLMSPFLSSVDEIADEMGWSDSSDNEGSFSDFPDGLVKIPDDEGEKLKKRFFERHL